MTFEDIIVNDFNLHSHFMQFNNQKQNRDFILSILTDCIVDIFFNN